MKTKEAIDHFGNVRALADALGIDAVQSIYEWGDEPPRGRQFEIQVVTKGRLKANPAFHSKTKAA